MQKDLFQQWRETISSRPGSSNDSFSGMRHAMLHQATRQKLGKLLLRYAEHPIDDYSGLNQHVDRVIGQVVEFDWEPLGGV